MDTLANAFFGERPRAVVYVNVRPDKVPGEATKHYFTFGTLRPSHPKLFLLYPTDTAPAGTPHLCVLLGSQEALHTLLDSLPEYTAVERGAAGSVSQINCSEGTLSRLVTSHKRGGSTQLPEPCGDALMRELFLENYHLPRMFDVSI